MDSITQAFSSLANSGDNGGGFAGFLKGIAPYAGLGTAGAGLIGNIQANSARNSVLSAEMNRMNAYNKLTPADIANQTQQLEQPLNSNLVHNVGNAVSGQLAERGLSQAPGIQTQALAQGLAPYQLQEQQLAQQALFQKLGLPISAQPSPFGPYPQSTNMSQLWQALSRTFMNGQQGNQIPGQVPGGGSVTADALAPYMQMFQLGNSGATPGGSGSDISGILGNLTQQFTGDIGGQ
jgi:hypothetical protein